MGEINMNDLEKIREKISQCDDKIITVLAERMSYIQDIIAYKKSNGMPILQPEQQQHLLEVLTSKLDNNEFKEEILDIFEYIVKNSKKIQAKSLFSYNIMLVGFMGVGKTIVSSYLSQMLAMKRVEMDDLIVEKEGLSITGIFEEYGEEYFRNCESNIIIELQKKTQLVVSCGGGVVLCAENVRHMKENGRVVLLTAQPETIYERVKDSNERPVLNKNMNVEFIAGLMEKRREKYIKAADIIISTDNKSIHEICEELVGKLTSLD